MTDQERVIADALIMKAKIPVTWMPIAGTGEWAAYIDRIRIDTESGIPVHEQMLVISLDSLKQFLEPTQD